MNARPSTYLQGLGSLQLLAVLTVVIGHYWAHDTVYLNSVGVSFCFVYSGYFTRKRHAFGPSYGLKDHGRFLWNKLARLYPLHLLGIALGILGSFLTWHAGGVGPKIMLAHLTLTSPWLANPAYYFGANPVAWFICVLFFLYAVAPIVVRLLARIPTRWQVALIAVLIALEFIIGYAPDIETHSRLLGRYTHYALYQFPPIRLLDFATGIVLYNVSQTGWWQSARQRLTPRHSTVIEVTALVGFIALYYVGKQWLHPHCYRSLAASVPALDQRGRRHAHAPAKRETACSLIATGRGDLSAAIWRQLLSAVAVQADGAPALPDRLPARSPVCAGGRVLAGAPLHDHSPLPPHRAHTDRSSIEQFQTARI